MKPKTCLILAFILLSSIPFSLCVQETGENRYKIPTKPEETPVATMTPTSALQMSIIGDDCLNCHYNQNRSYVPQADEIAGHKDATDQCIYCHIENPVNKTEDKVVSDLHLLHSRTNDCYTCHQKDLTIKPDCGECHAGEDMLQASNGNVFAIHSPKDVGCKECHGKLFNRIHIENKPFPNDFRIPQ